MLNFILKPTSPGEVEHETTAGPVVCTLRGARPTWHRVFCAITRLNHCKGVGFSDRRGRRPPLPPVPRLRVLPGCGSSALGAT